MRCLITLLIFVNMATAEILTANYNISYGIFGSFGHAKAVLKQDGQSYEISMEAMTDGIAKTLSGNRREIFKSRGFIENGVFVPNIYTHDVFRKKKGKIRHEIKVYEFNHTAREILYQKRKYDDDLMLSKNSEILKYYTKNDLLSLFFNFKNLAPNKPKFKLTAAGANEKDGQIDVIKPQNKILTKFSKELGNGEIFIAFINQKIFSSERGELHLLLNEHGIAKKAILRDVLLFGDIRAEIAE